VRFEYDDNEDFNAYLDEENDEVRVFDLTYRPSEVLFAVDLEAYRDLLSGYDPGDHDGEKLVAPVTAAGAT
jgi:hypothetical protein